MLYGGFGGDTLVGGDDRDDLWGEDGSDWLYGGAGGDLAVAGAGDDLLIGEDGDDWLYAEDGNDFAYGGAGVDYLFGQGGNDVLVAQAGDDWLYGGAGNDVLNGGAGWDLYFGEAGSDTFEVWLTDMTSGGRDTVYDLKREGAEQDVLKLVGVTAAQTTFTALDGGTSVAVALAGGGAHFVFLAGLSTAQAQAATVFG